ncbi:MAG: hypothetical protein K2H90_05130 [Oscillospiraceae bacterium]|nr:hypothetical protein [Oscillospiraceae bacterium]
MIYANKLICELEEKYGEDFNWWIPDNLSFYDSELKNELPDNHPLKRIDAKAAAKNSRNDDILFFGGEEYYLVHLTYLKEHSDEFPKYKILRKSELMKFFEHDYLSGIQ